MDMYSSGKHKEECDALTHFLGEDMRDLCMTRSDILNQLCATKRASLLKNSPDQDSLGEIIENDDNEAGIVHEL